MWLVVGGGMAEVDFFLRKQVKASDPIGRRMARAQDHVMAR